MRKFSEFLMLKEDNGIVNSEVKLSDDSEHKPFITDDEHHPNLAVLVRAFKDSSKVNLPGPDGANKITTLDPNKGEISPKIKKKNLYLVGGAVRDHLAGKTPRDYDLVTDATPDEIRLILKHNGFTEVKPKVKKPKYDKHPEAGVKRRVFWVNGWDKQDKEYSVIARINNEEFEITTFHKNGKGKPPDKISFSNLDNDASSRDFTINSMYIPLTTDGPNSKLIDPHGGIHHIKSKELKFIGDPDKVLADDNSKALRFARFAARFNDKEIPDNVKAAFANIKDLKDVDRKSIKDEFMLGLEHPDTDTQKYINGYNDLGLLDTVFPGMKFNTKNIDKKDKRLVLAYLLNQNDPEDVKDVLSKNGFPGHEINDVSHLICLKNWADKFDGPEFFDSFYDMKNGLNGTSLVPSVLRQWAAMNGIDDVINHYIQHDMNTKGYSSDELGNRTVNPVLKDLFGRNPEGEEWSQGIKHIENDNFRKRFK